MRTRRLASRAAPCLALSIWVEPETNIVYRSASIAGVGSLMATTALTDRRSVSIYAAGTVVATPDAGGGNRTALIAGLGTLAAVYTLTDTRAAVIAASGTMTAAYSYSAGGPTLTYIGSAADASSQTTYDFGDFSIPRDGLVIVGSVGRNTSGTPVLTSTSIGGTNGTVNVAPSGNTNPSGFVSRVVTAGTHNVTVVFSSLGLSRASCHVWLLENYSSATPVDTAGSNGSTNATSLTLTADISAGGFALYVGMKSNIATTAVTFSSATERYAQSTEIFMWAGDKYSASSISNHAETISWAESTLHGGSVVTFR